MNDKEKNTKVASSKGIYDDSGDSSSIDSHIANPMDKILCGGQDGADKIRGYNQKMVIAKLRMYYP